MEDKPLESSEPLFLHLEGGADGRTSSHQTLRAAMGCETRLAKAGAI